jgi:hypothetical protein
MTISSTICPYIHSRHIVNTLDEFPEKFGPNRKISLKGLSKREPIVFALRQLFDIPIRVVDTHYYVGSVAFMFARAPALLLDNQTSIRRLSLKSPVL